MKFRKLPVIIKAEQWFCQKDEIDGVGPYMFKGDDHCNHCSGYLKHHGWISTLEGGHIVCPGDWIITGIQGEKYPCKPKIFKATYELVGSEK